MSTGGQPGQVQGADTSRLPVGQALRAQREQLGWSLPDVAAWLRIRLSYLEALETGQVAKLPGNAYALGFLRAYSGALGLDPDDMSRRFRGEAKDVNRKPELSFPAPVPERGVPAGAIVLLGVLVVAGAYVGWYEVTGHEHRQVHAVPPVPPALLPYAGGSASPSPIREADPAERCDWMPTASSGTLRSRSRRNNRKTAVRLVVSPGVSASML